MLPDTMIESSPKRDIFFKKNGLIRGVHNLRMKPILPELTKICNDVYGTDYDFTEIIDLFQQMLIYDPEIRPCATKCLSHNWFKSNKPLHNNRNIKTNKIKTRKY